MAKGKDGGSRKQKVQNSWLNCLPPSAPIKKPSTHPVAGIISGVNFAKNRDLLPADISSDDMDILRELGFSFKGILETNPLLQKAPHPPGWQKVAMSDVTRFKLVDEDGTHWATITYKPTGERPSASLVLVREL